MYANPVHVPTQGIPCALQHYLYQMDTKELSHAPSQRERQMAFQHWVAYIRGSDCSHPSHVSTKEQLMCPLLWCRESFDSLASSLQHVSECGCLSNAWYWCPYCCRPESFMAPEEPCADTTQYRFQRKDSKLKRAVTFFKHLGLKSCSRHKSSGSSSAPETESFDTWLAKRKRFEMEDTSYNTSFPTELADTNMGTYIRPSDSEKPSKTVYEMEGTTLYTSWNLDNQPNYNQEAGTAIEACELDVGDLVVPPQSDGAAGKIDVSLTGIGAQFEASQHDAEPWEEMLVSPASATQSPFVCQGTEVDTSYHPECGLVSQTSSNSGTTPSADVVDHDWRQINVTPALNDSLLSSENDGSLCYGIILSTQSQVEELRETVRVLNEEWVRRCQSTPALVLHASSLSPNALFETGAQTLQHVFRGFLPRTFDAVFALAHITCASAYIMHGDDMSHCWNTFFQDILQWQHLLNESDARSFIRFVNLLWRPEASSTTLSCGNYFLDETSGTLVPLRRPAIAFRASSSTKTNDLQPPQWPTTPPSVAALTSLKNGAVLQECLRFLDGIEYAGILERSKQYPTHLAWYAQNHVTNIEEMLKMVIQPLQSCDGIEALRGSIDFTATELRTGSLRSVREVEVSLISNGKRSCLSPQVYKRYLDAVASTCDRAMHEAGPNWRDRCYVAHLDTVLASVVEMDTRQRLKQMVPRHQRSTNVNLIPDINQTLAGSIPAPSSTESQTLIDSPPSTITSPTITSGSSPTTQPSSTTSPESSFSPPSPSFSSTDITRCPLCPALFTGAARDRTSNLRRHMRTTRDHGNAVGLLCTVPGCGSILSRSDNLGKHIRTVHQGDTGTMLRRQGAGKRRRDDYAAE